MGRSFQFFLRPWSFLCKDLSVLPCFRNYTCCQTSFGVMLILFFDIILPWISSDPTTRVVLHLSLMVIRSSLSLFVSPFLSFNWCILNYLVVLFVFKTFIFVLFGPVLSCSGLRSSVVFVLLFYLGPIQRCLWSNIESL